MSSEKRIHRAKHDTENPYYIASRDTAQDKQISYDALGMLNYILSKPDDWVIQPTDLEREKCKRNKVYSILKELIKSTYVERIYHRNEKKQVVLVEYIAHEKPLVKKPLPEKPEMEKPKVENRHSTEYRVEQSTEDTKNTHKRGQSVTKKSPTVIFREEWDANTELGNELLRVFALDFVPAANQSVTTLKPYLDVAKEFAEIHVPCEHVALVYKYVAKLAKDGNWNTFGVTTLSKYYSDFLKQYKPVKVYDDPSMDLTKPMPNIMSKLQQAEVERKARENG